MNKLNFRFLAIASISITLSSCAVIAGIFKAGIWVGIILVIIIVALIFWLISKAGKN